MTIKIDGIVATAMVEVGVFTCTSTAIWAIPAKGATFDEDHPLTDPVGCFRHGLVVEVAVFAVVAGTWEWSGKAGRASWTPGVIDPVWEPLIGLQALSNIGVTEAPNLIGWAEPDLFVFRIREDLNRHQSAVEVPAVGAATERLPTIDCGHIVASPKPPAIIPALITCDIRVDFPVPF